MGPDQGEHGRVFRPSRGDAVEAWLKNWRDIRCVPGAWDSLNAMIREYRRHADTGTPLNAPVRREP